MTNLRATVDCKQLVKALRMALTGLRIGTGAVIRFDFASGRLGVEGPGAGSDIDATCETCGTALAPADMLKRWAAKPPAKATIEIRTDGSRFWIGSTGIDVVQTMDIAPKISSVPINATAADILVAVEREGELMVLATVGATTVQSAKSAWAEKVKNTAQSLKDYGVQDKDVETMMRHCLRRKAGLER